MTGLKLSHIIVFTSVVSSLRALYKMENWNYILCVNLHYFSVLLVSCFVLYINKIFITLYFVDKTIQMIHKNFFTLFVTFVLKDI